MSDLSELAAQVSHLRGARVLCVGDIMLDRYIYGTVDRISPEAPIPVLRVRRETAMLGGVGNVARNLVALGAQVVVVSVVGADDAMRTLAALLAQLTACEAILLQSPSRQTTIKTRCIGSSQQMLRVDRETLSCIDESEAQRILEGVRERMPAVDVVVLSDYGKGVLPSTVTREIIAMARDAGRPVVIDPKGNDYSRYGGATVITPNRAELELASGMASDDDDSLVAAGRRLVAQHQLEAVLVTRSEKGMTLIQASGAVHHLAAEAREVFDVSGAGDTVVATLGAAMAARLGLREAACLANVAGGIVVGKVGTAVVSADELIAAIRQRDIIASERKLVTPHEASERVRRWRDASSRIGFTNGCFDILHPGHIALLRQARTACDRLIVAVNSDASVRRLKGPQRPIQSDTARATVLASMEDVDMVVIFDQDTPLDLISDLRPDVLVKGSDYAVGEVVGADLVQSYGGQVLRVELVDVATTSDLLHKITNR